MSIKIEKRFRYRCGRRVLCTTHGAWLFRIESFQIIYFMAFAISTYISLSFCVFIFSSCPMCTMRFTYSRFYLARPETKAIITSDLLLREFDIFIVLEAYSVENLSFIIVYFRFGVSVCGAYYFCSFPSFFESSRRWIISSTVINHNTSQICRRNCVRRWR